MVSNDVYLLFLLYASVHILCVWFPTTYTYYFYSAVQVCIFFVCGFQKDIPIIFTLLCKCAHSLCVVSKDAYLLFLLCASVHILCVWFPKPYTYYVYSVQVCTFFVCGFQRRIPIFLYSVQVCIILCVWFPKTYTYYFYSAVQVCIFFVRGFQTRIPIIFTLCKCTYHLCVVSKHVYLLFLLYVSVHIICVCFPKTYIHSQHLSLWSSKLSGRSGQVRCTCSTTGNAKSLGLVTAREK